MANTNGAGDDVIGDGSSNGSTFGADLQLINILDANGMISYTGVGTGFGQSFGNITLATDEKIGNDPDSGGLSFDAYNIGNFSGPMKANGYIGIKDGFPAPSTIAGYALLYVDSGDGDLKIKFGDGTVKTISTDT